MRSAVGALFFRERRRLMFVASLAYLAGFLMYLPTGLFWGSVPIAVVTGALYAVIVGIAAFVVCAVLPSMRFMIEAVAVSRLLLAGFVLAWPSVGFQILANPLLTAMIVVTGGVLVSRVIHGPLRREAVAFWRIARTPYAPAISAGRPWQQRFVTWLDGAHPEARTI